MKSAKPLQQSTVNINTTIYINHDTLLIDNYVNEISLLTYWLQHIEILLWFWVGDYVSG